MLSFFELVALHYFTYAENDAYNLPIIYLFAIIFGITTKVNYRLQRGTYFLNSAFIVFLSSVSGGIFFLSFHALVNGYLFLIILLDIIIWAVAGYLFVIVAKARSNDAYGHSRYAALAFIPFANLWLLFTPSKDEFAPKMTALTSGVAAVLIGLIVTIAGRGLGVAIASSMDTHINTTVMPKYGNEISEKYFNYYAQSQSVNAALEYRKSLETIGQQIDNITYLNDIIIEDNSITYKFLITDNAITGFTQEQRDAWESYICDNSKMLFEWDASMVFHYYSEAEPLLAYIIGNDEVCSL